MPANLTDGAKAAVVRQAAVKLMDENPKAAAVLLTLAEVAELPAIIRARLFDLIHEGS